MYSDMSTRNVLRSKCVATRGKGIAREKCEHAKTKKPSTRWNPLLLVQFTSTNSPPSPSNPFLTPSSEISIFCINFVGVPFEFPSLLTGVPSPLPSSFALLTASSKHPSSTLEADVLALGKEFDETEVELEEVDRGGGMGTGGTLRWSVLIDKPDGDKGEGIKSKGIGLIDSPPPLNSHPPFSRFPSSTLSPFSSRGINPISLPLLTHSLQTPSNSSLPTQSPHPSNLNPSISNLVNSV